MKLVNLDFLAKLHLGLIVGLAKSVVVYYVLYFRHPLVRIQR